MIRHYFPITACVIAGLFCLGMGLQSILNPQSIADLIYFEFSRPAGTVEFMTVYGGFFSGIGLFLLLASAVRKHRESALLALGMASLGTFLLRAYGLLTIEQVPFFFQMLALEAFLTVIGFAGWWLERKD